MSVERHFMYRVCFGKRYDTDTAEHIFHIPCSKYRNDCEWENTDMYRSPKGQLFLAGEGEGASRWGRSELGGLVAGEGLTLLTDDEAKALLEKYDGPYEACFETEEG